MLDDRPRSSWHVPPSLLAKTTCYALGMLSIDHVRKQLGDPTLSDEEVGTIRDMCHALAESILEACEHRYARSKGSALSAETAQSGRPA